MRVELTLARIVDEAVLQSVDGVALGHHLFRQHRQLRRRQLGGTHRLLVPQGADREARLAHPRCVGDDAVEILRETLRLDQPLSPTVGAGVPVGLGDRLRVVARGDALGGSCRKVNRTVCVVDRLLWVAHHEGRARLLLRVVTGVCLRERKARLQRSGAL